ncbi:MAG TPA: cytochrome P450 [Mycobacterium sp.]|nr:cytochrome P450 [Mycobacterium sp.]
MRYGPGEVLLALARRRGPVINAGVGRYGYTYLLGAEANKFVFANSDSFSWWEAFQALVPVDGPTALIVSDGADHRRRRSLVQPGLHQRRVQQYTSVMAANADAVIDGWRPGQTIDVYQQFRAAIRRAAIASLFGPRLAAHADFLGEQLQPLMELADQLPQLVQIHQRLRTPTWRRAMAARARVDELIYAEIARVRSHRADDDNMLATLVHARNDGGEVLSDNEVRDQVVSLIAAGYATTSAAMAWAIYALLSIPGAWDTAADEVHRTLGGRVPDTGDLAGLTYLHGVVHETLRLCPPGVISARKVAQDLWFDGQRIRAGRMVIFSPYVTHRLPELWPQPLRFLPQRWDPSSSLYRRATPYEFLPFGGGTHRCIGSVFATTELMVMLARLLARTSLRLPAQRIRASGYAALRPRYGLTVDVTERG